jgi:hypothetical protein
MRYFQSLSPWYFQDPLHRVGERGCHATHARSPCQIRVGFPPQPMSAQRCTEFGIGGSHRLDQIDI